MAFHPLPTDVPFQVFNWTDVAAVVHPGAQQSATWQTLQWPGFRVRRVVYAPGYIADHWCQKGHLVLCLQGSVTCTLDNGEVYTLTEGMGYMVSDDYSSHRSSTESGVLLLIIDGSFLAGAGQDSDASA